MPETPPNPPPVVVSYLSARQAPEDRGAGWYWRSTYIKPHGPYVSEDRAVREAIAYHAEGIAIWGRATEISAGLLH